MDKSPGLLEEHGGHVRLKITWAMKLVSRIAEREREIQLGLPAGTLQNMGRKCLRIFIMLIYIIYAKEVTTTCQ